MKDNHQLRRPAASAAAAIQHKKTMRPAQETLAQPRNTTRKASSSWDTTTIAATSSSRHHASLMNFDNVLWPADSEGEDFKLNSKRIARMPRNSCQCCRPCRASLLRKRWGERRNLLSESPDEEWWRWRGELRPLSHNRSGTNGGPSPGGNKSSYPSSSLKKMSRHFFYDFIFF